MFLFVIAAPFNLFLMLNILDQLGTSVNSINAIDGEQNVIGKLAKCGEKSDFDPLADETCLTVGYSIFGQDLD